MASDVLVPDDLWEGDSQAVVTVWLAADGANVKAGQLIAEVMVEKTQYEIHAPAAGALNINVQVDDIVDKGAVLATIA